jgi:arginine exporter protein ArgO
MQACVTLLQGEVFAAGHVMNEPMLMGKTSSKAKARDNAMLAGGTRSASCLWLLTLVASQ